MRITYKLIALKDYYHYTDGFGIQLKILNGFEFEGFVEITDNSTKCLVTKGRNNSNAIKSVTLLHDIKLFNEKRKP